MTTPRTAMGLDASKLIVAIASLFLGVLPSLSGGQASLSASKSVAGPVTGTRITEQYARMVARDVYSWAWPMVNVYNRRLAFKGLPEPGLMGGIVPVAPLNRLSNAHRLHRTAGASGGMSETRMSCTAPGASGST